MVARVEPLNGIVLFGFILELKTRFLKEQIILSDIGFYWGFVTAVMQRDTFGCIGVHRRYILYSNKISMT